MEIQASFVDAKNPGRASSLPDEFIDTDRIRVRVDWIVVDNRTNNFTVLYYVPNAFLVSYTNNNNYASDVNIALLLLE